jgi:hypothetical protein
LTTSLRIPTFSLKPEYNGIYNKKIYEKLNEEKGE